MCSPFVPLACPAIDAGRSALQNGATAVGGSVVDTVIAGLAEAVQVGVEAVARLLTAWILVPSSDLCPAGQNFTGDWVQQCNSAQLPAQQLRGYLLPITVLVAVGALIWQGITIAITRKGEPLLQAVRGLWNTALWSGIGIAGTHAALKAGDAYSMWVLDQAIFSKSADPPNEAMSAALAGMLLPAASTGVAVAPFVVVMVGIIVMVVALLQTVLMVFREGSVVILAGLTQLSAAGTITRGTSAWMSKTLGWSLALIGYKPAVASVFAASFAMMGGTGRDFVMGLAMLALSIIALPVLLKFFTIFTGSVGSGNGSLGMLGAGAAAGMHAASAVRGAVGGNSAGEHARYMDSSGPGGRAPSGAIPAPPAGPGPAAGSPGAGRVIDGTAVPAAPGSAAATTPVAMPAGAQAAGPAGGAGAAAAGPAGAAVAGAATVAAAGAAGLRRGAATAASAMDPGGAR